MNYTTAECITLLNPHHSMRNSVFWDVAPSPLPRFSSVSPNCGQIVSYRPTLFFACGFLLPWRWRWHVNQKRRFIINPHSATPQKMAFFIITAVKSSNPTYHSCSHRNTITQGVWIEQSVQGLAMGWITEELSSSPGRVKNVLSSTLSTPALGLIQPPIQWVMGISSPG
jgi:hypothetical protein